MAYAKEAREPSHVRTWTRHVTASTLRSASRRIGSNGARWYGVTNHRPAARQPILPACLVQPPCIFGGDGHRPIQRLLRHPEAATAGRNYALVVRDRPQD